MWQYQSTIKAVFIKELIQFLNTECANAKAWNPQYQYVAGHSLMAKDETKIYWRIEFHSNEIVLKSQYRFITLRKGIRFNVVKGTLTIS